MDEELAFAIEVARDAGKILMRYYRGDYRTDWKGENDPVTSADREVNEFILERLRREFPDYGFLAEESSDNRDRLEKDRVWIVDPLDGTRDFIDRVPQFAAMIGLAVDGRPVLGVVNQVAAGKLFYGKVGEGAWLEFKGDRQPLHVSNNRDLFKAAITVSRSHRSPLTEEIEEKLGVAREVVSGSVGVKIGLIATRQVDIYVHPSLGIGIKEWDTCGPEAILVAAGGMMSDCWGEPLLYNQPNVYHMKGVVATNKVLHDEVIRATSEVCGRVLKE
jgi:3'(2'), 5'-bisphosphate nucleotidase